MSDTSDNIPFDAEAFGLPTGVNGESTPGFMYGDDDLQVDQNDPLYAATVKAMQDRGVNVPPPGTEERPPVMPTEGDGETPIQQAPATPTTPATPPTEDTPPPTQALEGDQSSSDSPPPDPSASSTSFDSGSADSTADSADDPAADSSEDDPNVLTFQVDGKDVTLDPEQGEYLLRVNTWMDNLTPEIKAQWAGIEQGTHIAITAQEYQELKAQAASSSTSTTSTTPPPPDLDTLDDDTVAYIESLEARVTPATQAPTQDVAPDSAAQPNQMEMQAAFRHQEDQRTAMMADLETTNTTYKERYSLTDEQLQRLEQVTTDLQVIPSLSRSLTQFSPTGGIIRQAPFGEVVAQAYDIAMGSDPALRQIRDEMIYNVRVAKDAKSNQATNSKKAKAGTLASAPSAAVPANGKGPQVSPDNKMDLQATSAAIANALTEMQEQS